MATPSPRIRPSPQITIGVLAIVLALIWNPGARGKGERHEALTLYRNHCASCHGIDGHGNGPDAAQIAGGVPDLMKPRLNGGNGLGSLRHSIADGTPAKGMPGFRGKLSSRELDLVAWEVSRMRKVYAQAHPEEMKTWMGTFRQLQKELQKAPVQHRP